MSKPERDYEGPGFDELRSFLASVAVDSPKVVATLDVAEKFGVGAVMFAHGGIGSRLMADRHLGGNFQPRTSAMFAEENANRAKNNAIADRIRSRVATDPKYAEAIEFLEKGVIRPMNRTSGESSAAKMSKISRGFAAIVAEVCELPKPPKNKHKKHSKNKR